MSPRQLIIRVARLSSAAFAAGLILAASAALAPSFSAAQAQTAATSAPRYLQLGSFRNAENAQRMLARFTNGLVLDGAVQGFVDQRVVNGVIYHRVRIGPIYSDAVARQALTEARARGVADAQLSPPLAQPGFAQAPTVPPLGPTYDPNRPTASFPTAPLAQPQPPVQPQTATSLEVVRFVQIGAFTDLNRANELLTRATASGPRMEGVIQTVSMRGGALHRVLVGPFSTDAEAAQAQYALQTRGVIGLAAALDPRGIETRNLPAPSAGVAIDPAAAERMPYLMVGSYRVPTNAYRALDHLRSGGMDTGAFGGGFIDTVNVSGDTFWRVRFGPIQSADRANQALSLAKMMGYGDARIVAPNFGN